MKLPPDIAKQLSSRRRVLFKGPVMDVNEDGQIVQLFTEDVPHYGDWIPGEGADICLYRAMDDNRIVGCCLPYPPTPPRKKGIR